MKALQIFLLALIIIGLGLLATQQWWVPPLVAQILKSEGGVKTYQTKTSPTSDFCYETDKYFVTEKYLSKGNAGTNVSVHYKSNPDEKTVCDGVVGKFDFAVATDTPVYYEMLVGDSLVLDSGTSPDPRGLIIYDLASRKQVFSDTYSRPVTVADHVLTYWSPTKTKSLELNCPKLSEYKSQGLGAVMLAEITLPLATLVKHETGQYRCAPTQG